VVGGVYVIGAAAFSGMAIAGVFTPGHPSAGTAAWVNGLQVVIGYLILSVIAATSLAEERVRGSLDVLMATPLSTPAIVLGKWLGTFRLVPLLMILPGLVAGSFALANGTLFSFMILLGYLLTLGAMVTSLGLALGVWVRQLGRAVGLTVALYCLLAVGWLFLCVALFHSIDGEYAAMGSPFMGAGGITFEIAEARNFAVRNDCRYVGWGVIWIILFAGAAVSLLAATLATFNRYLGRMRERVDWQRIAEMQLAKKPVPQVEV
jgi:ABC-type transport system involved in multi-copper enzyme maturation permease subunit